MKNKKQKNGKIIKIIYLYIISAVIVTVFSLSKYESTLTNSSGAKVAKWDNNLEIVDSNQVIFNNGEENTKIVSFKVTSNSEVSSKYDITVGNVPRNISVQLDDDTKCLVRQDDITISIKVNGEKKEATFQIGGESTTIPVSGGNIEVTSRKILNRHNIIFANDMNNKIIEVNLKDTENTASITFENIGEFTVGENKNKEHDLTFETSNNELPGAVEIELFASFEQID